MPGLFDHLARFARTPQGKRFVAQATTKAQEIAKDPAQRARLQRLRDQVTRRTTGRTRPPEPPVQP